MRLLKDIFHLFFPVVCLSCEMQLTQNETTICTSCRHDFPETNFTNTFENIIEKKFFGRIPIVEATSLFYFHKKGKVQHLIHQLKYKKHQEVGTLFGHWLGGEIINSNRFKNIDYIIPVPLHPKKMKSRGYNQLTKFGEALALEMNIPLINDKLIRITNTNSQSKKSKFDRWKNAQELFQLIDFDFFNNKHILLIDDVITTGATLEICTNEFLKSKNCKISIAVMAYTE